MIFFNTIHKLLWILESDSKIVLLIADIPVQTDVSFSLSFLSDSELTHTPLQCPHSPAPCQSLTALSPPHHLSHLLWLNFKHWFTTDCGILKMASAEPPIPVLVDKENKCCLEILHIWGKWPMKGKGYKQAHTQAMLHSSANERC